MSNRIFNRELLEFLEKQVVENGDVCIDSVFRFEKNPQDLPVFLRMAQKKNCTVVFENEGYRFTPDDSDDDSLLLQSVLIYMGMGKTLFGKRVNYLMNLLTNDNWVKGVHEPILKEGE